MCGVVNKQATCRQPMAESSNDRRRCSSNCTISASTDCVGGLYYKLGTIYTVRGCLMALLQIDLADVYIVLKFESPLETRAEIDKIITEKSCISDFFQAFMAP